MNTRKKLKTLKVPEEVFISYHTDYYDGIISGYCWIDNEYCFFECISEGEYKCEKHYGKNL